MTDHAAAVLPAEDPPGRRAAGLDPDQVASLIQLALAEDLAGGQDVTTAATVPAATAAGPG